MDKELLLIYEERQYYLDKVVLLANSPYEVKMNTLEMRFFVVNKNNELIYFDKLPGMFLIREVRTSLKYE